MPIKYEKELLKIVNTDDINERYKLSCNLLNDIACRKIYRNNRLDTEVDRYTNIGKENVRLRSMFYVEFQFAETCGIHYYIENPNQEAVVRQVIRNRDLTDVNKHVEITKDTPLDEICSFLTFSKDIEDRKRIYSILPQIRCVKNSNYKPFYYDKTPILCM